VGVFAETGHVVDRLVDVCLGAVGKRAEIEDGQRRFAELDKTDEILRSSDVEAANNTIDEPLHQPECVHSLIFDNTS